MSVLLLQPPFSSKVSVFCIQNTFPLLMKHWLQTGWYYTWQLGKRTGWEAKTIKEILILVMCGAQNRCILYDFIFKHQQFFFNLEDTPFTRRDSLTLCCFPVWVTLNYPRLLAPFSFSSLWALFSQVFICQLFLFLLLPLYLIKPSVGVNSSSIEESIWILYPLNRLVFLKLKIT